MHTVFILYSAVVDRYYVGQTSNLEANLKRHNKGKNIKTKSGIPWKPVYLESFDSRAEAERREREIKESKSREQLRGFINLSENELK